MHPPPYGQPPHPYYPPQSYSPTQSYFPPPFQPPRFNPNRNFQRQNSFKPPQRQRSTSLTPKAEESAQDKPPSPVEEPQRPLVEQLVIEDVESRQQQLTPPPSPPSKIFLGNTVLTQGRYHVVSKHPKRYSAYSASLTISRKALPPPDVIQNAISIPPVKVQEDGSQNSSSVTETTPATSHIHTPTPGSPLSTSTSISSIQITPKPISKPPPLIKSFASLLRTSSTAVPKFALPTSSQIGFSVPGNLSVDTSLSPRQHSNLLGLLKTGAGNGPPPQITPRGLVNMGNMCFANSILQALVYTPPFWRLFSELGKYIGNGPVVGSGTQKDGKGTPLVDATYVIL